MLTIRYLPLLFPLPPQNLLDFLLLFYFSLLLPKGEFTPKHRRNFGGGKGMCKCPSNICYD
jgi:hypothetical protein